MPIYTLTGATPINFATDNGNGLNELVNIQLITATAATNAVPAVVSHVFVNKTMGAATGLTLENGPISGQTHVVKDAKGDAGSNNITITATGGFLIDGAATLVISANYGVARLFFNGTSWSAL